MNIRSSFTSSLKISLIASAVVAFALFFGISPAASEEKSDTATKTESKKQKEFSSAKEAADTLLRAAEAFDVGGLEEILGPDATDLIKSADPVGDKKRAMDFAAKSKEKRSLDVDPKNSKRTILSVGNDAFPLAIPIVQRKGKWIFDTKAGRDEMLMRRIGANELDALEICRGFVDAFRSMRETVALDITRQMGKPLVQARREVDTMLDRADTMLRLAPAGHSSGTRLSRRSAECPRPAERADRRWPGRD